MGRARKRPYGAEHRPLDVAAVFRGTPRTETGRDGSEWAVRSVSSDVKTYTCPGCSRQVPAGVTHVVAWRLDHLFGDDAALAERRHWHTDCWRRR